jgi:hypothetical protein
MTNGPVLASEDKLDQTKLINLGMYYPFNTLNFGRGLIVFDSLFGHMMVSFKTFLTYF